MGLRRFVELELDRPRRLAMTMRAAMRYDQTTGRVFFDDVASLATSLRAEVLVGLLWAALIGEDDALTIDQVGDMIELDRLPDVMRALRELLSPEEGNGARPPRAQPADGPGGSPAGPVPGMISGSATMSSGARRQRR